jgi:hypothetical protein
VSGRGTKHWYFMLGVLLCRIYIKTISEEGEIWTKGYPGQATKKLVFRFLTTVFSGL